MVLITDHTWSNHSQKLSFIFSVDHTYTIGHIIVLSSFHQIPHSIWLVTTVQYHFRHRLHLSYWSCCCPLWFSSDITPDSISHGGSLLVSTYTTFVWSVTSLSYLVFIIDHTQSDRYWQFSFDFGVDQTYTIGHVIILLVFVTDCTPSDRSWWFNFVFSVDRVL